MKTLLVTPPFSQLNTPYPATCYLTGFLRSKGHNVEQYDLGIDVINAIFSKKGLNKIFDTISIGRLGALSTIYIETIEPVIQFLKGKNPTLANRIVNMDYLPQSDRFDNLDITSFGTLGLQDHARYLATLYLNDIGDYITTYIDPDFGFSRYSEKLGIAASFKSVISRIEGDKTLISQFILDKWTEKISKDNFDLIGITIPFPGNLLSSLLMAKQCKKDNPKSKVVIGGGWVSTELRTLTESRLFNYVDYVILDDGEAPLEILLSHLNGEIPKKELLRTYYVINGEIQYSGENVSKNYHLNDLPAPDYKGLNLEQYISLLDTVNPMHSLWNNGRWNKLTLAHGCYWKRCAFCDTTLPYIRDFHQSNAKTVVDKIETIMAETGQSGFHFVDEAAPPVLLKELSLELIRRGLNISWWTNIRFEKTFTQGLAQLMALSGCIGVSGGVEVASDRLLKLMDKGVTVDQVTNITAALGSQGIMVHAYLMYGFPTETKQETIDALEVVRQLFSLDLIQSAYWHQFSLTAHSPVGQAPGKFGLTITGPTFEGFTKNDLEFDSEIDSSPEIFSKGLSTSLYNYMHGNGLDAPLSTWFNFSIPKTKVKKNYISQIIGESEVELKDTTQIIWTGIKIEYINSHLLCYDRTSQEKLKISTKEWLFIDELITATSFRNSCIKTLIQIDSIAKKHAIDLDDWLANDSAALLFSYGLIII
ncbi:MAG: hypothetical protein B6229_02410 [Spirochaetaceae bacterium 4572_7]|nr:MAG: hypothetical protein B6229_02410 [Spirochaetaceae bacterium 4572_7]